MSMTARNTLIGFMAVAATLLSLTPGVAEAGEITLTSVDKSVRFRGEFVGFEQDAYVIVYQGNELRVPAFSMLCEGEDCLTVAPAVELADNVNG